MAETIINGIPAELHKGMTWLARKFAYLLNDPSTDAQDVYQDLYVVYLERKADIERRPLKKTYQNKHSLWFIVFRNFLINRAIKARVQQEKLELFKKELANVETEE